MYSIVIAGGEGRRLWPLSTPEKPKPLLKAMKNKTLLELTIERLLCLSEKENIFVVITQKMEDAVGEILSGFPKENIIVEPVGKNTAPCIALAARKIHDKDDKAVIGVFPADHIILNNDHFCDCVKQGEKIANRCDELVLLGRQPGKAFPGYGYIILGEEIVSDNSIKYFYAKGFNEKPDLETAEKLMNEENILWNSGIYIGKVKKFIEEIRKYLPYEYDNIDRFYNDYYGLEKVYDSFASISFDYSITENLNSFIALSTYIERIDVGNFNAFYDLWEKDDQNNAVCGEFLGVESKNNIIYSDKKPIAAISINNIVVIDTDDGILICPRDKVFEIAKVKEKWDIANNKFDNHHC